jgi:radical SAM enzyme (TIGR01210 family)
MNPNPSTEQQILEATRQARKDYGFDDQHDPTRPALLWFQQSIEGETLFVVFYTQACRWSRCSGCNLPSAMSRKHIGFELLMAQVDHVFRHPEVRHRRERLRKVIVSNNGSVLDELTFSSTALMYLIACLNRELPHLEVLTLETRIEYVDEAELEFIARALREGETPTHLELAVGLEVFDDHLRNAVFQKGLELSRLEALCPYLARYGFHLKCYVMQKPVPDMTDEAAVSDVQRAIDYLSGLAARHGLRINLHLNPTYAARGTPLEKALLQGRYSPPRLCDIARAALHAEGKPISVFLGLSDEHLACEGGSFVGPGDAPLVDALEQFNRTQDFALLRAIAGAPP